MGSSIHNFFLWYQFILRHAFNVRGRACRKDWYLFALSAMTLSLIFDFLFMIPAIAAFESWVQGMLALYAIVMLLPLSIRRLHDTNRSGWELLWLFVPLAGWFYLLVLFYLDGSIKDNQYGASTKSIYNAY